MKKKTIIIILSSFISLVIIVLIIAYFLFLHHYKGNDIQDVWNPRDEFNINNIKTIEKEKDQDFIILNLADIQICDLENFFNKEIIKKEIDELITTIKPNLITLTGDQTWSNENLISLKSIISWLDGYQIPYAPVFGNHDYGNQKDSAVLSKNKCMDLYENGKYSLFSRGPSNLGTSGNYIVNIKEDDKIIKTLYMLDSGYEDMITSEQINWVKWNADNIKKYNDNQYVEGMAFFHKPIPEYRYAYQAYLNNNDLALTDIYVTYSLVGSKQNGFFEMAKEINIKDIICGHQHGNSFTINYDNINLTFALKTGEFGGYYEDENIYLNGATYFAITNDIIIYNNYFVDKNKYKISG